MSNPIFRRSEETIFSEIGDDIVALNIPNGRSYGMENVAAAVWNLLEKPTDIHRICEELQCRYEVDPDTCRKDVNQLIDHFRREGLIDEVAPGLE